MSMQASGHPRGCSHPAVTRRSRCAGRVSPRERPARFALVWDLLHRTDLSRWTEHVVVEFAAWDGWHYALDIKTVVAMDRERSSVVFPTAHSTLGQIRQDERCADLARRFERATMSHRTVYGAAVQASDRYEVYGLAWHVA